MPFEEYIEKKHSLLLCSIKVVRTLAKDLLIFKCLDYFLYKHCVYKSFYKSWKLESIEFLNPSKVSHLVDKMLLLGFFASLCLASCLTLICYMDLTYEFLVIMIVMLVHVF